MPELPEVETIRSGLERALCAGTRIKSVELRRADIRFPIPKNLPARLKDQKLKGIRRRAKYILFDFENVTLLSHLGMTGGWRIECDSRKIILGAHDHCLIHLYDGRTLIYRDPRRFGILDLIVPDKEEQHPRLKELGVEPLDAEAFHAQFLFQASRRRSVAIKAFIMDQKVVVGIGNIYASEALFSAQIRPTKPAGRLTQAEAKSLVQASREVLKAAILAGGSTIRDYTSASGEKGGFQDQHLVYERAGQACRDCNTAIKSKVISGRSTYWCPTCQK